MVSSYEELPGREIVSTRVFAATPEQVFAAWQQAETLGRWWGPKDFINTFESFGMQPGSAGARSLGRRSFPGLPSWATLLTPLGVNRQSGCFIRCPGG